jgi:uncharacterized protein DUF4390
MPAWSKTAKRLLAALALLLALPIALAAFKVAELQARFQNDVLIVNGQLQLELSRKVEEAVSKGIELPVIIEVRLYRKRALLWDERVETWLLRRSLRYHALSGQYIVGSGKSYDSFLEPTDALKHLGTLSELRLPLSDPELATQEHSVKLRVHIDIEALPAPLRPVAYTTLSWHLNSGWTTWDVPP